jgi:uncharacterized protein YjiS (DUF1127 family)
MANFVNTPSQPFGSVAIFRVTNFVETAVMSVVKWNQARKTKNVLSKLTARELADIGLTRGDINNVF